MAQSVSANNVIHWTQKPVTVAILLTTGHKLNYNKNIYQGLKETLLHKNTWEWYKLYVKINHQHHADLLFYTFIKRTIIMHLLTTHLNFES